MTTLDEAPHQRNILTLPLGSEDCTMYVDLVWGGGAGSHGAVEVTTAAGGQSIVARLGAPSALMLANRIVRAANLAMERGEDAPSLDQELAALLAEGAG